MLDCHFPLPHKRLLVIHVMAHSCLSNHAMEMGSPTVTRST